MEKIEIKVFCIGAVQTNCYFVMNHETKQLLLVDPGDNVSKLAEEVNKTSYEPVAILLTHGHYDHAGASEELSKLFQIPIYAQEGEQETLGNPSYNLSGFQGKARSYYADFYMKDQEELYLAGFEIVTIHTPGHTKGGCCYYFPKEEMIFTGDTLFCQSVGRSDFPGGSHETLITSIREKLFTLPETTVAYPGHMNPTTIGQEKKWNPFFR